MEGDYRSDVRCVVKVAKNWDSSNSSIHLSGFESIFPNHSTTRMVIVIEKHM